MPRAGSISRREIFVASPPTTVSSDATPSMLSPVWSTWCSSAACVARPTTGKPPARRRARAPPRPAGAATVRAHVDAGTNGSWVLAISGVLQSARVASRRAEMHAAGSQTGSRREQAGAMSRQGRQEQRAGRCEEWAQVIFQTSEAWSSEVRAELERHADGKRRGARDVWSCVPTERVVPKCRKTIQRKANGKGNPDL
ncbi:hypothetical protein GGX14DRAFT_391961 [Mycena pura]|uniref:Uncharacterized protein n=1 Tax=Mycena pura TaxID=153505 RepID=A0AAD6YI89_9AGAR|nr:hypothetical protein GGX14DRAFT_391961 [Mycena pura]